MEEENLVCPTLLAADEVCLVESQESTDTLEPFPWRNEILVAFIADLEVHDLSTMTALDSEVKGHSVLKKCYYT